ncbi:hypothetical protein PISMIDRAFT_99144 [Pisolithus microcarpus 441]|uniref:Uncharacterized protein n=1 Tax=Pisolithus microcarpus 441 TaxID=765257 RepID=A0A0C9Z4Z2_9AGAM|nr:hypothetical protein BKA83DRAFT_99144 [Pisolithus microcarpus]KIK24191.1 hypothetical protein PISMIDRAFT_99144 [Pisolithus microcarpus 441]
MSDVSNMTSSHLCIWQQNLNKSNLNQHSLLHGPHMQNWDIYMLQELYIHPNKNTISSPKFYTIYPTTHFSHPERASRAVMLISTAISTNMETNPIPITRCSSYSA